VRRWRLAKKIYLPGWVIRIEIGEIPGSDGEWAVGKDGGVIRLRPGLTQTEQKSTLSHELMHAVIDYNNAMLGG